MSDINFNGGKAINLGDAKFEQDGVNLRTLRRFSSVLTANTVSAMVSGITAGNNIAISGTTSAITISLSGNITTNSVNSGTFLSAGTDLYSIFLTTADGNDITRVQPGSNITTGGTANNPIVNIVSSPSFNNFSFSGTGDGSSLFVSTLSGGTLFSGNTNLYDIFQTQNYFTTGSTFNAGNGIISFDRNDTINAYSVNIDGRYLPISGGTVTGNTLFTNNLSATTFYSGGTDISLLFGSGGGGELYWTSGSTGNFSIKTINDSGLDSTGNYSLAEGSNTKAFGSYSHAEGESTSAITLGSHSEGSYTIAGGVGGGDYAHAEGNQTIAFGESSHAEGERTTASGYTSHAEGLSTIASGDHSHAEGDLTIASGHASHAEGRSTIASGTNSHAEGYQTTASGTYTHAEGWNTTASGNYSHAEGRNTIASNNYAHAEGYQTTASGTYSHSEGYNTIAAGSRSHAEGNITTASGYTSHAEGYLTIALGDYSHVGGQNSFASGNTSFVHGSGSTAGGEHSVVFGRNIIGTRADTTYVDALNIKTLTGTSIYNLGIDVNGFVVSGTSGGGGTFTGGTVIGETIFSAGLSATSISADTYYNIPTSFGTGANGGGGTISTGVTGYMVMSNSGRITGWDLIGSISGTVEMDIWKISGSTLPNISNSITASAKPRITEGVYSGSTTLIGWPELTYNAGDKFGFNIDSVSGFTSVTLTIRGFKSN